MNNDKERYLPRVFDDVGLSSKIDGQAWPGYFQVKWSM